MDLWEGANAASLGKWQRRVSLAIREISRILVHIDLDESMSFVIFLRYSFYRPRNILTILDLLNRIVDKSDPKRVFQYDDFYSGEFKRAYGD